MMLIPWDRDIRAPDLHNDDVPKAKTVSATDEIRGVQIKTKHDRN